VTLYVVEVEGRRFEVDVDAGGVRVDGRAVRVEGLDGDRVGRGSLVVDGRPLPFRAERGTEPGAWEIEIGGRTWSVSALTRGRRTLRDRARAVAGPAAATFRLTAPMPGLIVAIEVEPGTPVQKGQGLVIMEAMKMENELRSEVDGVVEAVHVRPRQIVERGAPLVVVAPAPPETP
jgi:pyruvate carboxylase subunit B